MISDVTLICNRELDIIDMNLIKLLNFFEIKYTIKHLDNLEELKQCIENNDHYCVFINCDSIKKNTPNNFINYTNVAFSIVYNVSSYTDISIINNLSNGFIKSVSAFESNDYEYEICNNNENICKQYSGLKFGPVNKETDFKFEIDNNFEISSLININNSPLFIKTNIDSSEVFFLSSNAILDIDENLYSMQNTKEFFSQIIPISMFIKYAFNKSCWHNINHFANITVDDPLLKSKYGFLNYKILLKEIKQHDFSASIAFIPYNYKKSCESVTENFRENSEKLTICVHGCDHIKNEFGITDISELNTRAKLAKEKMLIHKELTNMNFDNIMVFPYEIYSTLSLKALKANNYLAATTYRMPVDNNKTFKIYHLLNPAMLEFENFPVFHRRKITEMLDLVFDLFWGKPALIFLHHQDFKDECKEIVHFVNKINSLNGKIKWTGLQEILENSYMQRIKDENTIEVKVFTGRANIKNNHDRPMKYIITKEETCNVPIKKVLVDNQEMDYKLDNDILEVSINIQQKRNVILEIIYQSLNIEENYNDRKINTFIIRNLSEFRDNYIYTNKLLFYFFEKLFLKKKHSVNYN